MNKSKQAHGWERIEEWGEIMCGYWVIRQEKKGFWDLFWIIVALLRILKNRRNIDLCFGNTVLVALRRQN